MKKILKLIIYIIIFLMLFMTVTGCTIDTNAYDINSYIQDYGTYKIMVDKETCIEYIVIHNIGGITVRYNTDGTIKLNSKCLGE